MKIYQIHEYGGEWEDKFDYIVGSYLSEERAIAEKMKLETNEENYIKRAEKCSKCPLYAYSKEYSTYNLHLYCDDYEPFDEDIHDPNEYDEDEECINYTSHHSWEYASYYIEEVEVVE